MKTQRARDSSPVGLRSVALLVLVFGSVGAVGLLRHAQHHPPPVVVVGFIVWVLAPFGLLALANILSTPWEPALRGTLFALTLFVVAASLAIYVDDHFARRTAKPAFVYVAVPPVSVLLSGIVLAVAAVKTRKRNATGT